MGKVNNNDSISALNGEDLLLIKTDHSKGLCRVIFKVLSLDANHV